MGEREPAKQPSWVPRYHWHPPGQHGQAWYHIHQPLSWQQMQGLAVGVTGSEQKKLSDGGDDRGCGRG